MSTKIEVSVVVPTFVVSTKMSSFTERVVLGVPGGLVLWTVSLTLGNDLRAPSPVTWNPWAVWQTCLPSDSTDLWLGSISKKLKLVHLFLTRFAGGFYDEVSFEEV